MRSLKCKLKHWIWRLTSRNIKVFSYYYLSKPDKLLPLLKKRHAWFAVEELNTHTFGRVANGYSPAALIQTSSQVFVSYVFLILPPSLGERFVFSAWSPLAIVSQQPFNPGLTNVFSKPIVSNKSSADSAMNMHINLSPRRAAATVHQKKKFSSNYTSKSAIITTLYIICIFQLIFKSCIGVCMQMYNIFRIRYITIKSISIQPLPCFSLISRVPW